MGAQLRLIRFMVIRAPAHQRVQELTGAEGMIELLHMKIFYKHFLVVQDKEVEK